MFNKNVLSLSPTKYKFNIFFFFFFVPPPPHLTTIGHEKLLLFYYFLFPKAPISKVQWPPPQSLKIYIHCIYFFLLLFLLLLLPFTSHFQSSLQFAPNFFFLFPSIYVCNNTSRVKAVDPIVSFSKLFLSFSLSLSSLSSTGRNLYFSPKLTGMAGMTQNCPELDSRWNRWYYYYHSELHPGMRSSHYSYRNGTDLIH